MRTTVTLDPDVADLLDEAMRARGISFKEAVNQAIRAGLAPRPRRRYRQRTFEMGFRPEVPYDQALRLAAQLEGEELVRKAALGK